MGTVTYKNQPAIESTKGNVPLAGNAHIYRVKKVLWPEDVESFLKTLFVGRTLHVCCGASRLGDVRLDADNSHDPDIVCDAANMRGAVKDGEYETTQKIGDLRYGMKGITVRAKVVKIPPARLVFTRWGTSASVSNVTLADETGSIRLGLWNGQIKTAHVGDEVEVNNGSVKRFKGELHLRLRRNSSISIIHDR